MNKLCQTSLIYKLKYYPSSSSSFFLHVTSTLPMQEPVLLLLLLLHSEQTHISKYCITISKVLQYNQLFPSVVIM